jgi:peptide/nickel transport system permease protein
MSTLGHLSDVEPPAPTTAPTRGAEARDVRSVTGTLGAVGTALLLLLLAVALFAPALARHDPDLPTGRPYEAPSAAHPLGTNDVGQDLFAQLLHGSRISLAIGVLAALLAVSVGLAVALLAGYHRGRLDTLLMRVVDLTLAFPFLVLVIVLAAFFGRGLATTVMVIGAVIWARPARVLRSQVLKVREFAHVTAAQAMGASPVRIIGRHLLPRVAPLAAAQFVRAANIAVLIEASLAFLGLGDPNRVSWGTMLYFANARNAFLTDAWVWWILPPGLALTLAVVGFAFLGYAVEERSDPRLARAAVRHPARRRRGASRREDGQPRAGAGGPGLELRDLVVEYRTPAGPLRAVEGVDLTVGRGRVVGLVGESGSGKSTLAMAVLGLVRPPGRVVRGEIGLDGRALRALSPAELAAVRGRDVALVPQSAMNALNPAYTVHRQVAEAAILTRADPREAAARASELLELVGIPAERHRAYPHELSGGMRQRVVIAMAVANQPSLLVADEPVTGLDVVTQARILRLLLDLRSRLGLSILLISHDLPVVARVADDLAVMYAGRIVERGPTAAVTADPGHPYTAQLLRAFPRLRGPRHRLVSIPGAPPDLLAPPSGCRFHPRCPHAAPVCLPEEPPLVDIRPDQQAACVLRQQGVLA